MDNLAPALIAAGSAILATFITLRVSLRNLRVQLEHDAAQKAEERRFALKKEIYLRAIEAYKRFAEKLLTDADTRSEMHNDLQIAIAKIELICNPHIFKYTRVLSEKLVEMSQNMPSVDHDKSLFKKEFHETVDRIRTEIELIRETKNTTQRLLKEEVNDKNEFVEEASKHMGETKNGTGKTVQVISKAILMVTEENEKIKSVARALRFIIDNIEPYAAEMFIQLRNDLGILTTKEDTEAALKFSLRQRECMLNYLAGLDDGVKQREKWIAETKGQLAMQSSKLNS
jgi:hypothetical protein